MAFLTTSLFSSSSTSQFPQPPKPLFITASTSYTSPAGLGTRKPFPWRFSLPSSRSQSLVHVQSAKGLHFATDQAVSVSPTTPVIPIETGQVVERLVLFVILPGVSQEKVDALEQGLKNLGSIKTVNHLTAGPLHRNRSPWNFPIYLHVRFNSKKDMDYYLSTSQYLNLHIELMDPICTEVLLLQWFADVRDQAFPPTGHAIRTTFYKMKDGAGESEKQQVLKLIRELEEFHGSILQHTFGDNFTAKDAKGYSLGSVAILPGLNELQHMDTNESLQAHMEKIKDLVEDVVDFDYVF